MPRSKREGCLYGWLALWRAAAGTTGTFSQHIAEVKMTLVDEQVTAVRFDMKLNLSFIQVLCLCVASSEFLYVMCL